MSVNIGTFLLKSGEVDTVNVIRIANDHTDSIDTSFTPYLEVNVRGETDLACSPIEGEWEDGNNYAALVAVGSVSALLPSAVGVAIDYECIIDFTKPGIHARYGDGPSNERWAFRIIRVA